MDIQAKRNLLNSLITGTNGKFFTIVNVKADGQARRYGQARIGVSVGVTGAGSTTSHKDNLRTIWENKPKDVKKPLHYRALNLDTVTEFKFKDTVMTFDDEFTQAALVKAKAVA